MEVIIKTEDSHGLALSNSGQGIRIRSVTENGHETIEILSDSEEEACNIPDNCSCGAAPSDVTLVDIGDFSGSESESDEYIPGSQDMASDDEINLRPLDTQWLDPDVTSRISDKPRCLNWQLLVERIEYVTGLPSYWPIPQVKTAYIVDLSDPQYNIYDGNGKLLTVDALIKNKVSYYFCL